MATAAEQLENTSERVGYEVVGTMEEVKEEVKEKFREFATEARIDITTEEKLIITKMENEFLKAQAEAQRVQQIMQNVQKQYPAKIEELISKYKISTETHVFDIVEGAFKRK